MQVHPHFLLFFAFPFAPAPAPPPPLPPMPPPFDFLAPPGDADEGTLALALVASAVELKRRQP